MRGDGGAGKLPGTDTAAGALVLLSPSSRLNDVQLFTPTVHAAERLADFFTAHTQNDHTRRAYYTATKRFTAWCLAQGIGQLAAVRPIHIAAFLKDVGREHSAPTVKQHLAALRSLFDWLVVGQVIDVNPAHAVRGPKHSVTKGKTPLLEASEARLLLDSIEVVRPDGIPCLIGLRDRALISTMVYSFARIGAVLKMRLPDYYIQGRRGWVRLHEKGGKEHTLPCHHNLERYLDEYVAGAGLVGDVGLFQTMARRSDVLTGNPMCQPDAYRMIARRAKAAGIATRIGNHSFRATGITAYLKNGGTIEKAQQIANHSSPRTTKLYDRRSDDVSLDEIEKIGI